MKVSFVTVTLSNGKNLDIVYRIVHHEDRHEVVTNSRHTGRRQAAKIAIRMVRFYRVHIPTIRTRGSTRSHDRA
ncbi:hypothetical protein PsorP6_009904 [Peronosclerospora sorghi]|uniref:Uncharacterized protein n=1 Tax=Peronosclerospora sorghi TaxID=230839 RepID=A0ACC0VXL8_9STRA|nr:hypothetical protein PsorP6_009904 [Peronosclerospora sorghi]